MLRYADVRIRIGIERLRYCVSCVEVLARMPHWGVKGDLRYGLKCAKGVK